MEDKKLSAGEVGLEVVGYTTQQDIDWQGDCALRKAPMLDYSIPLVRLSDAQRLLAAARLQTAMLATCAKNVADERDQLRALLTAQPQASAAQSAPAGEREALERELLSVLDFSESNLRRVVDHLLGAGYSRAACQRTQSAGVAGVLIVPIQPTEEMRKRAQDYLAAEGMIVSDWLVHTAYTEMLAAAPAQPAAQEGESK